MVGRSFKLSLLIVILQVLFVPRCLEAATFAVGKVYDASDCTEAGWRIIHLYLPANPNNFEVGIINPETGYYVANVGEGGLDAAEGEIVFAVVVDSGDGYDAGPVQLAVSSVGSNIFPDMYLRKPGIEPAPGYPECSDVDNDYINDVSDNCIFTPNTFQADSDNDGIGDKCDKCDGPCPCESADLDSSGQVNFADFAQLAEDWQGEGAALLGDVNGDDMVNTKDLAIIVQYWLWPCDE